MTNILEFENQSFAERLAIKLACERSFLNFTRIFFELLQGDRMLVNWHHRYVAEEVDRIVVGGDHSTNLILNQPPGSTKTEFMSIHLPAYTNMLVQTGQLKRFRNLNLSYADTLVKRNSRRTRDIINSREFQEFWPCKFGVNQAEEWEIVNKSGKVVGQTVSRAMGGQITGGRAGFFGDEFSGAVNLDDCDKPEDMFSQTKREAQERKMVNTVRSRRGDKSEEHPTPFILTQQRLHVKDTTGFCMSGGMGIKFKQIKIPALITEKYIATLPDHIQELCWNDIKDSECVVLGGEKHWSFWPQMEGIKQLLDLRERDPYTFNSQYQQDPIKLSGNLVNTDNFGRYSALPHLLWLAVYVDTNSGKVTDRNDFTVFTLCGMGADGKMYLIEIKRGKWTPTELLKEAKDCWNRWRSMSPPDKKVTLRYMKVEDKQAGQGLIADLQKENNIPVKPVQRGQGQNKYVRHCNCEPKISMRKVMIPETYDEEGNRIVQTTWEDGTPAAPNDWVLSFLAECDALTIGILMDTESGYDDQYDTLMDAIDDMLDTSSVRDYGALL